MFANEVFPKAKQWAGKSHLPGYQEDIQDSG